MTQALLTRRALIAAAAALVPLRPVLAQSGPAIHVVKDPNCGCCTEWARILHDQGFAVSFEHVSNDALYRLKLAAGIPPALHSCHTARIEGYRIEGHVPVADIRRLLAERPDAVGLSVPGMPWGSPGMGPESEREAYSVYLIRRDGTAELFSSYPKG